MTNLLQNDEDQVMMQGMQAMLIVIIGKVVGGIVMLIGKGVEGIAGGIVLRGKIVSIVITRIRRIIVERRMRLRRLNCRNMHSTMENQGRRLRDW
jgi:hypothetical protein